MDSKKEVIILDCKKVINQLLLERNTNITELAGKLGIQPQSLRNKINRGNYSINDFQGILEILDCDLQVVANESNGLEIQSKSLKNKINKGNYSIKDFQEILEILDCDLQAVANDSNKIFQ